MIKKIEINSEGLKWFVIDVEDIPEVIKAKNLDEAINKAIMNMGVREMDKDEEEVYFI